MTWLRDVGLQATLALGLSLIFWTFVTFRTNPDVHRTYSNIPVGIQGLASNLVIVDEDGTPRQGNLATVSVEIETDQATLANLNQNDLQAFVALTDLRAGTHRVPVTVQAAQRNVMFQTVEPESLAIQIERLITRTVPITIEVEGTLPFSYERGDPEVSFNNQPVSDVLVSGPQSQVARVMVAAAAVDINQVRATYVSTLPLQALDANGDVVEGVTLQPDRVRVRVTVTSVVGLKRVPVLGNVIGSPALGYVVTGVQSDPPLINLVGSSSVLDNIDRVDTTPIDISGATSTITRTVPIRFGRAQPQEGEARQATVTVQIAALNQPFQVQVGVPIQVTGAAPGLLIDVNPQVAQLQLEGSTNALVQLNADRLVGAVDVAGLGPGSYTLTPQLTLPDQVQVVGTLPAVTVVLRFPPTPTLTVTPRPTPTEDELPLETPEAAPDGSPTDAPAPSPTAESEEPEEALTPTLEPEPPTEPAATPTAPPTPTAEPTAPPSPEAETPTQSARRPTPTDDVTPLPDRPADDMPVGSLPNGRADTVSSTNTITSTPGRP